MTCFATISSLCRVPTKVRIGFMLISAADGVAVFFGAKRLHLRFVAAAVRLLSPYVDPVIPGFLSEWLDEERARMVRR